MGGLVLLGIAALVAWAAATVLFDRYGTHGSGADYPSQRWYEFERAYKGAYPDEDDDGATRGTHARSGDAAP